MALKMLTVGGFYPASGKNTIRKLSEKYKMLKIGDEVRMVYVRNADEKEEGDNLLGKETLTIKAISRGRREHLIAAAAPDNHGCFVSTIDAINNICALYPDSTKDDEFIAIWFN